MTIRDRFYPTPSTVKYYIQGIELDDIYRVDYNRTVRHNPVYGYDSKKFGFIARGKELVTGNIIVNYRYPGYLTTAILNFTVNESAAKVGVENKFGNKNSTFVSKETLEVDLGAIDGLGSVDDKAKAIANRLLEGNFLSNDEIIARLKKNFEDRHLRRQEEEDFSIYSSPLDIDLAKLKFDMTVRYGFQDIEHGYVRVFKDCYLIGESETVSAAAGTGGDMSSSAQPILEVYPFFCRTIETVSSEGEINKLLHNIKDQQDFISSP
ncbi:MAG: hypothetical protein D6710_08300 [Nitrospirae bacterium]|nr:MAG: hypothetical protein D6710_08300 [Nitrospirota bacterium]